MNRPILGRSHLVSRDVRGASRNTTSHTGIPLRGLGRIDVLPGNDSGVRANLARFAGKPVSAAHVVEQLAERSRSVPRILRMLVIARTVSVALPFTRIVRSSRREPERGFDLDRVGREVSHSTQTVTLGLGAPMPADRFENPSTAADHSRGSSRRRRRRLHRTLSCRVACHR